MLSFLSASLQCYFCGIASYAASPLCKNNHISNVGTYHKILKLCGCVAGGAASVGDEHWLNLALELKPLDEMVGDRGRLMEEVFAILGGDQQLNELLPEVIRKANHSPEEIRELLGGFLLIF